MSLIEHVATHAVAEGIRKLGESAIKEAKGFKECMRNPPPYDQLSDRQKIFAGGRETWEAARKRHLRR
ncbi:hypothetical protein HQ531_06085 [bacterium]|nr:hypothetical protein [bacterium]